MYVIEHITELETLFLGGKALLKDIRGIIFDLDDTLYPEKAYVRSGYKAVAKLFPEVSGMEEKLWQAFLEKKPAIDAVLADLKMNTAENKEAALRAYRYQEPDIAFYPGVKEMIEKLKDSGRFKLGLITDGRPEGQWAKIRALGLKDLLDEVLITDALGGISCRKPNPKAFRLMAEAFGLSPGEMVYIGDNPAKDFGACEVLGMESIWFKNADGIYSGVYAS